VNAGVNLGNISLQQMSGAVPAGIFSGLFIGKQLGVFCFSLLAIKLKIASLPEHCTWLQLYGVSVLTGIGFTMSLFVDSLAFTDDAMYQYADRLAILLASFMSGIAGYFILRLARSR
jgi:NhaA family Na+:H+ antiporter